MAVETGPKWRQHGLRLLIDAVMVEILPAQTGQLREPDLGLATHTSCTHSGVLLNNLGRCIFVPFDDSREIVLLWTNLVRQVGTIHRRVASVEVTVLITTV